MEFVEREAAEKDSDVEWYKQYKLGHGCLSYLFGSAGYQTVWHPILFSIEGICSQHDWKRLREPSDDQR